MYRTVKTTDKPAVSPGQPEGFGSGHGGEISDEFAPGNAAAADVVSSTVAARDSQLLHQGLWSNSSSRGAWLQAGSVDSQSSMTYLKEKSSSPESSTTLSGTNHKSPNLEFTLGRPH
ncbi:unnamed protein product [Victoria cruziana]